METKIRTVLSVLALSFFVFLLELGIVSCQFQLEELRSFLIEVDKDGSAVYIFMRKFILEAEDDKAVFEQYLSGFEDVREGLLERFSKDTSYMVSRAANITGRNMTAKDFNVSAYLLQTITGSQGVIEYKFVWINFALVHGGEVQVGDVFDIGLVLLEGDELTIKYPNGYKVLNVEPEPDFKRDRERELTWFGSRFFTGGTPMVILNKEVAGFFENPPTYGLAIGLAISGAIIGSIFFYRFRKKRKKETLEYVHAVAQEGESEEEKILNLLRASGGCLPQSVVVEKLGFSRSKTSETLSSMEKKGLIKRQKKGREKLVMLPRQ